MGYPERGCSADTGGEPRVVDQVRGASLLGVAETATPDRPCPVGGWFRGGGMEGLSWRARAYIYGVLASTLALGTWTLVARSHLVGSTPGLDVVAFVAATTVAEFMAVPLPRGGWLSVSTIPHVALALLFPPPVAMAISALAML